MPKNHESFESMLTGGHPNSLGRTEEVTEIVLNDQTQLDELYHCYFSQDEVVRLRTSGAIKRVCIAQPDWLVPYLDRFLTVIANIDQASTQWTLVLLFNMLQDRMTAEQKAAAQKHMQHNLKHHKDWIVLNNTMQVLAEWSAEDAQLREWLIPELERLTEETRKSVANRAKKLLKSFA